MYYLKIPFRALWKTWFLLNFITGLVVLYPFFYVLLLRREWFPLAFKLKRFWACWILVGAGIIPIVKKRFDPAAIKGPVVFCGNHTSYLDIVVSYVALSKYFIFMGKAELGRAPLFNIFFKRMNILVDRKSRMGSYKAFEQAGQEIDRGNSVFIFPEATISKKVPELLPYKNGAFKLAIEKQVPIVPVIFIDNFRRLQNGGFFKSRGSIGLISTITLDPIHTAGMTEANLDELKSKTFNIITATLQEHYGSNSSK